MLLWRKKLLMITTIILISTIEFFILIKFQELFHKMLICFQIKIGTLEGNLARLSYEDLLENPLLRFSGRNQVSYHGFLLSDLHSWNHLSASVRHFERHQNQSY